MGTGAGICPAGFRRRLFRQKQGNRGSLRPRLLLCKGRHVLLPLLLHNDKEADEMRRGGDAPGHRVRQVQGEQGVIPGEYGEDPQDPQAAGAGEGNHRGQHRIAQAPDAAAAGVHNAAEEIGGADQLQPNNRVLDHLLVRGVNPQKLVAEQIEQNAKPYAYAHHHAQAAEQNGRQAAAPARPPGSGW